MLAKSDAKFWHIKLGVATDGSIFRKSVRISRLQTWGLPRLARKSEGTHMQVFRGPIAGTHTWVSRLTGTELEKAVRDNHVRFSVTKEDFPERESGCTLKFEDGDVVPMIAGLLPRIQMQNECIGRIRAVARSGSESDAQKVALIAEALRLLDREFE
jgi:hypothetical protein